MPNSNSTVDALSISSLMRMDENHQTRESIFDGFEPYLIEEFPGLMEVNDKSNKGKENNIPSSHGKALKQPVVDREGSASYKTATTTTTTTTSLITDNDDSEKKVTAFDNYIVTKEDPESRRLLVDAALKEYLNENEEAQETTLIELKKEIQRVRTEVESMKQQMNRPGLFKRVLSTVHNFGFIVLSKFSVCYSRIVCLIMVIIGACFATVVVTSTRIVKWTDDVQLHTTNPKWQMEQQGCSFPANPDATSKSKESSSALVAAGITNTATLLPKVVGAQMAASSTETQQFPIVDTTSTNVAIPVKGAETTVAQKSASHRLAAAWDKAKKATDEELEAAAIAVSRNPHDHSLSFIKMYNSSFLYAAAATRTIELAKNGEDIPLTQTSAQQVLNVLGCKMRHCLHADFTKDEATRTKQDERLQLDKKCWLAAVFASLFGIVDRFEHNPKITDFSPEEVTDHIARVIFHHYRGAIDENDAETMVSLNEISLINPRGLNLPQEDLHERECILFCLQVNNSRLHY